MDKNVIKKLLHRKSMRGLRKCPSCGHYSGSRAQSCKNEQCDQSIKSGIRKSHLESVQLITNKNDSLVYSVQTRIPTPSTDVNRNFVEIFNQKFDSNNEANQPVRCLIESCKYGLHDLSLCCKHVKSCLETRKQASCVKIYPHHLGSLNIDEMVKKRLWSEYCADQVKYPTVQQINTSWFVVRCKQSVNSLEIVHFFIKQSSTGSFFICYCDMSDRSNRLLKTKRNKHSELITVPELYKEKCDHFYLILAAICSNESMHHDYKQFICSDDLFKDQQVEEMFNSLLVNDDFIQFSENILNDSTDATVSQCNEHVSSDLTLSLTNIPITDQHIKENMESLQLLDCQIELMDDFKLTDQIDLCNEDIGYLVDDDFMIGDPIICDMPLNYDTNTSDHHTNQLSDNLIIEQKEIISLLPRKLPIQRIRTEPKLTIEQQLELIYKREAAIVGPSYENWLDSIIERINCTMDFNGNGYPEPLTFSVSHLFFSGLRSRFALGNNSKRRLPNATTQLKVGPYKGLTQFVWIFTNEKILQNIFATKNMSIDMERKFSIDTTGTFTYIDPNIIDMADNLDYQFGRPIKPTEYKTFILVKPLNAKNRIQETFTIEWIPNVLPKSKYGEMKIIFKYGHKKNNEIISVVKTDVRQ